MNSYGSVCFFFFNQKTAYEITVRDWSSDVCSSDLCNIVDVLIVQGGNADAAAVHAIDPEFAAQALHLLLREARVAEHPDLIDDESEVLLHARGLQPLDQRVPHLLDPRAHARQFLLPLRTQRRR